MEEKNCLDCGIKIFGRMDKKFCSDQCRNSYNNKRNSDSSNYVRNVNNILRRNRRILMDLNPNGKSKSHRDRLGEKGFDFNYYTNTYTTKAGTIYYFCYEYGYLPLPNNFYALVKKQEYVD
jgi:predicted nucleic acid-binding Zn ribbon protein